eukprot:ANDGO_05878.mRNA.1 hypothetical protein
MSGRPATIDDVLQNSYYPAVLDRMSRGGKKQMLRDGQCFRPGVCTTVRSVNSLYGPPVPRRLAPDEITKIRNAIVKIPPDVLMESPSSPKSARKPPRPKSSGDGDGNGNGNGGGGGARSTTPGGRPWMFAARATEAVEHSPVARRRKKKEGKKEESRLKDDRLLVEERTVDWALLDLDTPLLNMERLPYLDECFLVLQKLWSDFGFPEDAQIDSSRRILEDSHKSYARALAEVNSLLIYRAMSARLVKKLRLKQELESCEGSLLLSEYRALMQELRSSWIEWKMAYPWNAAGMVFHGLSVGLVVENECRRLGIC